MLGMSEPALSDQTIHRIGVLNALVVSAGTIGIGVWANRAYRGWLRRLNPVEDIRAGVAGAGARLRDRREGVAETWHMVRDLIR